MFVFVICLLFLFVYVFRPSALCIEYFYFWYAPHWFWFYVVTRLPFFVYISWYCSLLIFHCFLPANLIRVRVLLILIRRFISRVHSVQRSQLFQVFVFGFVRGIHCSPCVFLSKACVLYHFWCRAVFYSLYYLGERNTRKRHYISALNPFQ